MAVTFFNQRCCLFSLASRRSVSMIDMRDEDEAALQPHSQFRHERMHNQYNRIREEDNHWQNVRVPGYSELAVWSEDNNYTKKSLI